MVGGVFWHWVFVLVVQVLFQQPHLHPIWVVGGVVGPPSFHFWLVLVVNSVWLGLVPLHHPFVGWGVVVVYRLPQSPGGLLVVGRAHNCFYYLALSSCYLDCLGLIEALVLLGEGPPPQPPPPAKPTPHLDPPWGLGPNRGRPGGALTRFDSSKE